MHYGLDDLVTELAYATGLHKAEAKRFYKTLVVQLESLMRQGRGARCPGLGSWSFLANSKRQKGSSVGLADDADLRAAWFIGFAFEADPTFLRVHGLAAAPAPHELMVPATRVNYSAIARGCGLDRDQVSRAMVALAERLGAACAKHQVRLDSGNLGRFCADNRVCRFDFGARAPRPLGLSTTYDATFTRAGREPPPSARPVTSPIVTAGTTPRNHRSVRRSRASYVTSAGRTPRPIGGFDREFSVPIDDAEQGRRTGLEVAKRTMELFRAQGDEVNGLGAALRCHAAKECARRYPLHGPHSWCGKREAVSMRAFPPLGYASQAHITGTRPLDTVGRRESGVSSLY
jgi:hypothetical protein